jgi:hypothetical protein
VDSATLFAANCAAAASDDHAVIAAVQSTQKLNDEQHLKHSLQLAFTQSLINKCVVSGRFQLQ